MLVIPFNRTIPKTERISHIGKLIVETEPDLLLAWAVAGAERLLRRGYYPEHDFATEALQEWAESSDAVLGWIEERIVTGMSVVGQPLPRESSAELYADFKFWAAGQGLRADRIPAINPLSQRVEAALADRGVVRRRSGSFRGFLGLRLRPGGDRKATYEDFTKPFNAA